MPGKTLGFWPTTLETWGNMKNKHGFSKVVVSNSADVTKAIIAGFDISQMMANVNRETMTYPSGNFDYYFIDEPFEKRPDHPRVGVGELKILANNLEPSLLLMSSYKIAGLDWDGTQEMYYDAIFNSYNGNTRIMSDNYWGAWAPWGCNLSQTEYWDDYKESYGYKNNSNWISLLIDGEENEFLHLFNYLKQNGINEVWLFIGKEPNDGFWGCGDGSVLTQGIFDSYLKEYLKAAYQKGYLKRYYQKYRYDYRCYLPDPCETCDQSDVYSDGWYLKSVEPTGQIKEM